MSVVVLPRNAGANAFTEAQSKLRFLIDDALSVLAVVRGGHPNSEQVLEVASGRASTKPAIRRVVWVPDVSVLTPQQQADFFGNGGLLATIGIADKVARVLSAEDATVKYLVEKAFLEAEVQGL
jgi:hypothetical protein